ncbi:aldo/keto reductase [Aquimarina sediminis]|uniref:aldo/keto reductase n=1 Tax=Aquimarina sediminis TaxID=2070536 RepID=UPI000CA00760|nr:aldo/keto reductase [Aquimarina sediminis]
MNTVKPLIGLGTAAIGRPQYINVRQEEGASISLEEFRNKGRDTLEYAYQNGIRYFDTAPGYGLAEELLLDWVKTKQDPDIEVATKWGYTYVANFDPTATTHEIKEHSLTKLNEQWLQSQKLLPYLKIYQVHSATFDSGILENEEILKRLYELKSKHNLIMGITTTGDNQIEVIKKTLNIVIEGNSLFDAFQVTYNVLDQSLNDIMDTLKEQHNKVIIKEALANGRLFPNDNYLTYQPLYQILQKLADKYKVGIDAIALRFCIDSIQPYKVLSGAANSDHITDNLKVSNFTLNTNEIEILKSFRSKPSEYWEERKKLGWN